MSVRSIVSRGRCIVLRRHLGPDGQPPLRRRWKTQVMHYHPRSSKNDKDPAPPPASLGNWKVGVRILPFSVATPRAPRFGRPPGLGCFCLFVCSFVCVSFVCPLSDSSPFFTSFFRLFVPLLRRHASQGCEPAGRRPALQDARLQPGQALHDRRRAVPPVARRLPQSRGESRTQYNATRSHCVVDSISPHTTRVAPEFVTTRNASSFRRGEIVRRRHAAARNHSVRDTARRA